MNATDLLVAGPTLEPLTLVDAKLHLKETASGQDALITSLMKAARTYAENFCTHAMVLQTRRLLLDCFPPEINIYWGPLRAISSVQYLDEAGALQTLAASQYRVDKSSLPARITEAPEVTWPTTYTAMHAVRVEYTCGHLLPFTADAGTDVLTAAGHGFADADQTMVQTIGGALPTGLSANTNYHVQDATANTLKLSATAGGAAIDITAAGTPPNVLGELPEPIRHALRVLIQYFEQRDANVKLIEAAENLLSPYRVVRF